MQEPSIDAHTIPAGYLTPPKARPSKTEVRILFWACSFTENPSGCLPHDSPYDIHSDDLAVCLERYLEAHVDIPDHWLQEWVDVDDGTMEGSLGYGNILASPPAAYLQLQARLLARRLQSAAD